MALAKGVNSYVTVDEADAYFADRLDVAAWTEAGSTEKGQALVTATAVLDDQLWTGVAISTLQPLAWPRAGGYFDTRIGDTVTLDATVPVRILKATYELAHHLLNNDGLLDNTGEVVSLSISTIKLTKITSANLVPGNVKRLILPLLQTGGSSMWWRAN